MINILKGCPRCCGDLSLNYGTYGEFYDCLQCGHYLSDCGVIDLNRDTVALRMADSPSVTKWASVELAA